MSLREASRELRLSVLRHGGQGGFAAGPSRQANLAVPMTLGTLELAQGSALPGARDRLEPGSGVRREPSTG
jgi:hypothetical protein